MLSPQNWQNSNAIASKCLNKLVPCIRHCHMLTEYVLDNLQTYCNIISIWISINETFISLRYNYFQTAFF